ncbi:MAG: hypothetical protein JNL74_18390 [Fibrobacteres bacterium]|nr:hypothetical protein [Fibrobacterota bacterium]
MKTLLLTILFLLVAGLDAEPVYVKYRQAFGFKASNISGYGAYYGVRPSEKTRIQITGIGYLYNGSWGKDTAEIKNYSIGLEFQKDIIQEEKYRYYLMVGGYYYSDDDKTTGSKNFHKILDSYNAGVGIGFDYMILRRVSLGVELGYKIFRDYWDEKRGDEEPVPCHEYQSKVGAGMNLGFVF